MRIRHTMRSLSLLVIALGTVLLGACGESPTAPDQSPSLAAATSGPLSVDLRSLRLSCTAGSPCTGGVIVHTTTPVTLAYQVEGSDFEINSGLTTCAQGGMVADACFINVKVASYDAPGRRVGKLIISESTTGTSLSVRLTARMR